MKQATVVVLAAAALWCLAGCSMWGAKKNPGWKMATSAEQFERLLWEDISQGKWPAVKKRMAPMVMWSDAHGTVKGRAAVMERIKALDPGAVQVGEVESAPAGADMVVTYTVTTQKLGTLRALDVWQAVGNDWVLIAHSTS